MSGNPIKDTFYYDVSEYERKKNPNITNEEVFAKAQEYRQKPESFYSKVYKDLNGVSIDNKTLNEASIQTGIKMDPNKLPPDSINWVDNDKRDLIEEKKQINKLQSSISVPLDATDAEIDQFYKKEVFPKNQSRIAEDTGGLDAKKTEWINSEKKMISDLTQKKNAYNEKYPNVDLKPVPVDNFFKDSQKVTSKNKAIGNVAAAGVSQGFIAMGGEILSTAWDSAKDFFSGNDAKQERINAKLDSEAYVQVLEEKAKKRFENIKDPVEKKILNEMFSGKKPQVPEGYKASKEMDAFLNDYDNLNVQLDINATQFGSMVGGKKKTYAQQLQDHEAEVAKVRDEDQNWLTKGKKNSPSVGRTWVNMALNGMVEGVDLLFDAFGTNTREERLKEAKKSGNTEEYLKLQRSFALDDFKEDQKNIEETAQRTDLTAPIWENRVEVDGFKIQLDNKGNVQRLVDNSGKTVHTLSNSQQNAIAKYQANPEKYKIEEGFSANATGSLINAVGTTTVQMIPMIIGGVATAPLRGAGALGVFAANTIPMSTMFVPQYARYFNEEFEKSGDWTRASKYGTAMAGFESMIEWVGGVESRFAQRLTGPTSLRQAVSEAGKRTADFALNVDNLANFSYTGKFFKELSKDIGTEMAEEIATLYGQSAIDGAYGNDSTVDFNELLTTLLVTPFATAPLASISSAANYKNNKNEFKGMVIAASNDYDKTAEIMGTLIASKTIKKEDAEKKLELVKAVSDRRTNYAERAGNRKLNFTNQENTQLEDYMYEEAMGTINGKKINYDKEVDAIIAAALKRTVFESAQEENEPVILDDNEEDIDEKEEIITEVPETEPVVGEIPAVENVDEDGPQPPNEPGPDDEEITPDEDGSARPDFDESKQYSSGIVDLWLRWKNRPKKVATEDNFQKHKTIGVDGQYSTYTNEPGTIKEGRSALNFNIGKDDAQILAQEIKGIAANTGIPVRVDVADSYNTTDIPLRVSFLNDNDAKTMHSLLEQSDYYRNVKPAPTDRILGKKLNDFVQFGVGNMKDLRNAQDIIENTTKDQDGNYIYEKDGDLIPLSPQEYEQIGDFLLRAEKNWDNASGQEFVSEEPPKIPYQRPVDVAANNYGNLGSDQSRTGGEVQTRVTDEKQAERLNSKPNVSLNTAFEYQEGDLKEIPVSYKGTNGLLKVNQGGVVEFENGRNTYEFGNIADIGNKSLSDLGLESTIDFRATAKNEIIIGDRTFVNLYDSPEGAINYDENGNVESVDLQEKIVTGGYNGIKTGTTYQPITFTGAQAMDVAVMLIENNIIINPEERAIFEMAPIIGVEPVYVKPNVNIFTVTQNLLPFFPNDPEKASDMAKMYFIVANRMSANFPTQFPTPESYVISRINKINDSVVYNENNMLVQYLRGLLNSTDIDIETMQSIMDYIDNLSRVSEIYGEEAKTPEEIDAELQNLVENTPGALIRTGIINGDDAFFTFPGQRPWGDISKELQSGNVSAYVISDDFKAKDLSDIDFNEYMDQGLAQEFINQGYDGAIVMGIDGEPTIHVYNLAKTSLLDPRFPDLRNAPKLEDVIREQEEYFDDLISGSSIENRKNGFFIKDGIRYDRNTEVKGITGNKGMVSFTRKVEVPYVYMVVEASTLQPSHTSGIINPLYFIPEAQPKPRTDIASINAELSFANNPDFTKLGENTMAYSGAPVINQYGEVVQGNNRVAGLKLGYNQRNKDYRKAIIENADKFGLDQDGVMMMKEPILVRKLNITDEYAIELGNYDVKDLETGGTERINPGRIAMRIPFETKGQITNALFVGEEDLTTLAAIRQNQQRILPFIYPHLNEAQRNTMTNADGSLNDKGIDDVAGVINYFLFNGGDVELPQIFEDLTDVQKKGLLKALPYIFSVPVAKSILPEIQNAIIIMSTYLNSSTKDFDQWTRQIDMFTGSTPTNMYTPFELALVNMIRLAKTQKEVRLKIGEYSVAVLPREGDMFSPASDGMTKKDAIKQVFNVEYDEKVRPKSPERGPEAPVGQENQNPEGDQVGANEEAENPAEVNPALKDVDSTAKALEGFSYDVLKNLDDDIDLENFRESLSEDDKKDWDNLQILVFDKNANKKEVEKLRNKFKPLEQKWFSENSANPKKISESYHKAKIDGSYPELVEVVESLLSQGQTPTPLEQNVAPKATVVQPLSALQGFTEGVDLNRIFAASKAKYGEKDGAKYNDAANRLVNPNTNTIIEVRSNGVVVKEGDKYSLIPFTNTDANYKKWNLGRPLDVTEQYINPVVEPQPVVGVKAKIGQDVNINGLDSSYRLTPISPQEAMYKQGYRYNGRFDFPVSLGENGNYSEDNLYKEIPTEQQVIDDIIRTLKYELETYNEEEYLSGRDEAIKEVLDKLNLESFTPQKPVVVPQGNPLSNFESGTFVYRDTPNGRQEFYIFNATGNKWELISRPGGKTVYVDSNELGFEKLDVIENPLLFTEEIQAVENTLNRVTEFDYMKNTFIWQTYSSSRTNLDVYKTGKYPNGRKATTADRDGIYNELIIASGILNNFIQKEEQLASNQNNVLGIEILKVKNKENNNIVLRDKYTNVPDIDYEGGFRFVGNSLENKENVDQSKPFAIGYFGDNNVNVYEFAVASNNVSDIIDLIKSFDYQEAVLEVYDPATKQRNAFDIYPFANEYTNESVGLVTTIPEAQPEGVIRTEPEPMILPEGVPSGKIATKDLGNYTEDKVIINMMSVAPEFTDILTDALETNRALVAIDEKPIFPYRFYSQLLNNNKATPETKQREVDAFIGKIEEGKARLLNPPTPEQLAEARRLKAEKEDKKRLDREEAVEMAKVKGEAFADRNRKIEDIRQKEAQFIDENGLKQSDLFVATLLFEGVSKDNIILAKKVYDIIKDVDLNSIDTSVANNNRYRYGAFDKVFDALSKYKFDIGNIINALKSKESTDMFFNEKRNIAIERLNALLSNDRKPIVLKDITILPPERANEAEAQLMIVQSRKYYTLWLAFPVLPGSSQRWTNYTYLTTLSTDLDTAREKADGYIQKLAEGQALSQAFMGRNMQDIKSRKTIALVTEITPESELKMIERNMPTGLDYVQKFGKYQGFTLQEIIEKDPDYAEWLASQRNNQNNIRVSDTIMQHPTFQQAADIRELEQARINAYEEREAKRDSGEKVSIVTLVRGDDNKIVEVNEDTAEIVKKPVVKLERRIVKDQILDIIGPNVSVQDNVRPVLKFNMFQSQIDGANVAINSMVENGVFLNGDGAGTGKAMPLDTPILTNNGWVLMGDIKVGDMVASVDGTFAKVKGVYPQGLRPTNIVYFSDNTNTECCDEHLWFTKTSNDRKNSCRINNDNWDGGVKEFSEIKKTLLARNGTRLNHSIPVTEPIKFGEQNFIIEPYTLGTLLGDGYMRDLTLTNPDTEIADIISSRLGEKCKLVKIKVNNEKRCDVYGIVSNGFADNEYKQEIKNLDLYTKRSNDKFIPSKYLFSSVEQRIELLRGLMDTDGYVNKNGTSTQITTVSNRLANDIKFLVQSLGGIVTLKSKKPKYTYNGETRTGQLAYTLTLSMPANINPFNLARKADLVRPKTKYKPTRYITGFDEIGLKECQCISVDHPSSLYLVNDCIVTHNTRQIVAVADYFARQGKPVIIVSENAAIGKPWDKAGSNPRLGGSMEKDSQEMGIGLNLLDGPVEDGNIYVSTYHRIKDEDVPNGAIVIFDESQNLANTFGRSVDQDEEEKNWEIKFKSILSRVDATAYYSATPADKPHQLAYLHKVLGFDTPEEFLNEALNNGTVVATRSYGRKETKYYDVPYSQAKRKRLYSWINNLMVRAGEDGRFIKREISYEGTDVQFHDVGGTNESTNEYAKMFNDVMDDMIAAQKSGYTLLAPASYVLYAAELAKIGEAVKIAKREKEAGRKVIIFLSRIKPMEIRGKVKTMDGWSDPTVVGNIPSPVDIIKEAMDAEGISFVELHGKSKKSSQQVQKEFAGNADALIASLESGGTGINLDDTVGDNPRTEIFMFAPYRGISTIQGMGRIWRASTIQNDNSPNRYVFITASDIDLDLTRSSVLAKKLQLMDAAIGGTAVNKLPMSKVSYTKKELVGVELPDSGEESQIGGRPRTGILKPVDINFKPTKKGGFYANANADVLEWVERGGPERTGLDVRVFKGDNGWIVLSDKEYGPDEFAPPGINDGEPEALEVPIETTPEEIIKNEEEYVMDMNKEQKPEPPINTEPVKSNTEQDIEKAEKEIVELRKNMILGFYPAMASDAQKILELQEYVKVKKGVLLDEKIKQKSDEVLNKFKDYYKNGGGIGIIGGDPEQQSKDFAKLLSLGKDLVELYIQKGMVNFKEIADAIIELTNETSKEFIDMLKGVYLFTSVTNDDLTDTKDEVKSYKNNKITGYDSMPVKDPQDKERIEQVKKDAQDKIIEIEEEIAANDGQSDAELDFIVLNNENIISEADNALGNNKSIIDQYFDPNIGEGDRLIMSKEMIFSEYLDRGIMEFEPIARDLYHKKGVLLEPLFDEIKSTYSFIQRRNIREMGNLLEADVSGYTYDTLFNERPPEDVFIDLVRKSLKDGIKMNINSLRSLAAQSGLVDFKDTQIQEYTELAIIENAKEISKDRSLNKEEKYDKIIALYELQPTISMRSSTRIEDQQYSTPIPMSFVAGEFVNSISPKSVLEPSAGNGMMVFNVPSHKITVNEKDPVRLSTLRKQGFKSVLNQDGRLPFIGPRYDAIVTNPPFGSSPERMYGRYRIGGLDEQMSINALQSMNDNGRAAIIIGGHMSYQPNGHVKSERIFINYLYQHYNVVDIINMGGNLYAKQGTTFPTRMILIDGRRMDTDVVRFAPKESEVDNSVITNFKDLYNRVNSVKNETVSQPSEPTPVISRIKLPSGGNNIPDSGIQGSLFDLPVPGGRGESNASGGGRNNAPGKPIKPTTSIDSNNGDGRNDTPDQEVSWRDDSFDFGPRVNIVLGADNTTDVSGRTDSINIEEESLPYSPQSKSMGLNSKIPTNMAQPLYNILQQFGDIDAYVQQRLQYKTKAELYESLSAEQIDGVALAIYQIENGKAMIIGDMTGMGKGREAASIIRYAVLQGKKPIFITEKPDLFSDMHRDLVDIKTGSLKPFIVNTKGEKDPSITIEVDGADGKKKLQIVHKSMTNEQKEPIFRSGRVPDEFDYVVATYSQFSQKESEKNVKKPWLSSIIEDNIFILDESHNAGGTGNTNDFFLDILSKAQGGAFLSATFAKRPDNMPVYALKTDISLANMSQDEIINAVKTGGLPLQQIMSTNLVTSGQMIRRERDFTGVTIDWDVLDDSKAEHEVIFDSVTEIFSDIIAFQREHVNPIIEGLDETAKDGVQSVDAKGVKDLGISNTQFASKTFNAIRQLLLALKAKDVARIAIEELQAGRKPIIALANTMESFLNDMGFSENEDVPSLDFSLVLKKGLDGSLRYKENTLFDKKPIHRSLSLNDLTNAGREDYYAIMNKINNASVGIAVSPIDVMIHEVEKAGYRIGELTGRDQRFNINDDGSAKLIKRQDKDKKKLVSNFNSGELDALIINQSGSTGISLHASEKFKDRKQRVMLFAQTQLDINTEVQLRGRIDRTGQGDIRGAYRYIISPVPAEKRLIMMFRSKLKSLDANTKSNQKSKLNETEVVDFLNKYGDEIVIEYLKENQDINEKLLDPFGFDNKSDEDVDTFVNEDGAASKVSGRVALLLVREQEDFYREVSDKYNAQIAYLDANNANDLEIKVLPLKAETLNSKVVIAGSDNNNPFASDSIMEEMEIDVLKKPMKAAEIKSTIDDLLGGKDIYQYRRDMVVDIDNYTQTLIDRASERIRTSDAKKKLAIIKKSQGYWDRFVEKQSENNETTMTPESIQEEINSEIASFDQKTEDKINKITDKKQNSSTYIKRVVNIFSPGKVYLVPISVVGNMEAGWSEGIFLGFKHKASLNPSGISAVFAVRDGRRRIEVPLSKSLYIESLIGNSTMNPSRTDLENWDSKIPDVSRRKAYIATGNLLQSFSVNKHGQMITFTMKDGSVRQGVLMPDNYKPENQKMRVQIIEGLDMLKNMTKLDDVTGSISFKKTMDRYGSNWIYEMFVPKTKADGAKYFSDPTLKEMTMEGEFNQIGGRMRATISERKIEEVLKYMSSKHNTSIEVDPKKPTNTRGGTLSRKPIDYDAMIQNMIISGEIQEVDDISEEPCIKY